ncbi:hypothetical protein KCU91_g82, partial [Aureobasidium melanogenum]
MLIRLGLLELRAFEQAGSLDVTTGQKVNVRRRLPSILGKLQDHDVTDLLSKIEAGQSCELDSTKTDREKRERLKDENKIKFPEYSLLDSKKEPARNKILVDKDRIEESSPSCSKTLLLLLLCGSANNYHCFVKCP